jgi:hypothetical protein
MKKDDIRRYRLNPYGGADPNKSEPFAKSSFLRTFAHIFLTDFLSRFYQDSALSGCFQRKKQTRRISKDAQK